MVKKDSMDEKPSYGLKNQVTGLSIPSGESFESVGKEKVEALQIVVDEIRNLVEERQKLSDSVIDDAEKEKRAIDNFMLDVEAKMEAGDIEGERERIALKQKRVDVSELQLNEKISAWQDIARLKQELREKTQELSEKQSRMEMFGKILGD